jgi:hypothetical protein
MKPCPWIGQLLLYVSRNSRSAWRSSSMVSKVRTQSRFSLSVRMNRSAQPLPSGARTKAAELSAEEGDLLLKMVPHVAIRDRAAR